MDATIAPSDARFFTDPHSKYVNAESDMGAAITDGLARPKLGEATIPADNGFVNVLSVRPAL